MGSICTELSRQSERSISAFGKHHLRGYTFHPKGFAVVTDDKVKIRCPGCTRMFREKASRVRDGFQVNCNNCNKLITLSKETEDPFIRRALKTARETRAAQETQLIARVYAGVASAPPRETP